MVTIKEQEGWALKDADGTYRTRTSVGQREADAALFADHEVDSYALAWGSRKVWMQRTVTTSVRVMSFPPAEGAPHE